MHHPAALPQNAEGTQLGPVNQQIVHHPIGAGIEPRHGNQQHQINYQQGQHGRVRRVQQGEHGFGAHGAPFGQGQGGNQQPVGKGREKIEVDGEETQGQGNGNENCRLQQPGAQQHPHPLNPGLQSTLGGVLPPGNPEHGGGVAQGQAHHQQHLGNGQGGAGGGQQGAGADALQTAGLGNLPIQQILHGIDNQGGTGQNSRIDQNQLFGLLIALQPVAGLFLKILCRWNTHGYSPMFLFLSKVIKHFGENSK